ncbi:MAG TPA: hypothetical protein ENK18_24010 [Deltaproteobacteria bacterium]|nr:hypothetical protein [Deltaproteobacteria bacterium]
MRWPTILLLSLGACVNDAEILDPCTGDDDCTPDYVCHLEDGAAEGVCWTCGHGDPDCGEPGAADTGA